MCNSRASAVIFFLFAFASASGTCVYAADASLKPEDLLTKHLDAIGSVAARGSAKTRVARGGAVYRILVGGGGRAEGKTGLVSEEQKLRFMVKLPGTDYVCETFVYDGKDVRVAFSNKNKSRSPLASFIATYDVISKEALLGSVLSTGWALANAGGATAEIDPPRFGEKWMVDSFITCVTRLETMPMSRYSSTSNPRRFAT